MTIKCPICLNEYDDTTQVCNACGFKFSGQTQKFEPVKTNAEEINTNNSNTNATVAPSSISNLRVIKGPQGEILLPLSKNTMSIGRSPDSDIFLNDRTVSREHAQIIKNGQKFQIADKNSFNGVWINNKNITVSDLNDGDIIQIGVFFLRFEK